MGTDSNIDRHDSIHREGHTDGAGRGALPRSMGGNAAKGDWGSRETGFDVEKRDSDQREAGLILLVVVLLVSCAVHLVLMYVCSSCSFAPLPEDVAGRAQSSEFHTVEAYEMTEDPYAFDLDAEEPPVAAPDTEELEERVERLTVAAGSPIAPDLPAAEAAAPMSEAAPSPAKSNPSEWKPRQQIATIDAPPVPDEGEGLPRIVIPKIARVPMAADIVPAYDLMRGPSSATAGGGVPPSSLSATADADAATSGTTATGPAVIPRSLELGRSVVSSQQPPSISELSAAVEDAAKRAADAEEAAAKAATAQAQKDAAAEAAKRPVPPAPKTTMIDEKVVEQEKEAVRVLRDETTVQGRPFEKHVVMGLGSWVDPTEPDYKYFRITVNSHSEQPLPVISKDIVFLMDASGSIANDRLKKCRSAFVKALRLLNTGDRFNVIAFRDKFTFAFPDVAWKEVTEDSLDDAEDWLKTLTAHGQTDVFRTLRGVLAMPRNPARPVVAFVVTDGDATSGETRSAEIISKFSALNGGLISVYMYGVKDSANAYLMDMLTRSSRGTWARNEKLRWNAADGIPDLAKKFERPVLSDISVLFTTSSRAETYPRLVSNLCEDEPLVIYGRCPADQKNLVFKMRGLNATEVYESLFTLSFGNAKPLTAGVRTEWAQRRIYEMIASYTAKAKPDLKLLQEIRAFAARYKIAIPYEKEIRK